jgi:endonuclease/exonuclease/phosphatase family metal-dependent hydrolase
MRLLRTSFFAMAAAVVCLPAAGGGDRADAAAHCRARAAQAGAAIAWQSGPIEDADALDAWCRGVGPPVFEPTPDRAPAPPALRDLVIVSWNAHLAEGRLADLVAALRAGALTGGRPVAHFVLLLQELYRRGPDVPPFTPDARTAHPIAPRDPEAPDVHGHRRTLGLATLYVPSMRNGAEVREDRGNGILSTEPLSDPLAFELPFERQRRVAVGAAIDVRTAEGIARLFVVNSHLEPLSAPSALWVFRNPRRRQVGALLDWLRQPRFEPGPRTAGTVLGGDFNTIQSGVEEDAYRQARAWSRSLVQEDPRSTHRMGRLDYLFFRLTPEWSAVAGRIEERFGSDHHPVIGAFQAGGEGR